MDPGADPRPSRMKAKDWLLGVGKFNRHVIEPTLKEKGWCPSLKQGADWLRGDRAPEGRAGGHLEWGVLSLLQPVPLCNEVI